MISARCEATWAGSRFGSRRPRSWGSARQYMVIALKPTGDADAVRVIALGTPGARPTYKKQFNGGVAGIAVADGDGDGVAEVIAVVRLAGATRVDVWRLD